MTEVTRMLGVPEREEANVAVVAVVAFPKKADAVMELPHTTGPELENVPALERAPVLFIVPVFVIVPVAVIVPTTMLGVPMRFDALVADVAEEADVADVAFPKKLDAVIVLPHTIGPELDRVPILENAPVFVWVPVDVMDPTTMLGVPTRFDALVAVVADVDVVAFPRKLVAVIELPHVIGPELENVPMLEKAPVLENVPVDVIDPTEMLGVPEIP